MPRVDWSRCLLALAALLVLAVPSAAPAAPVTFDNECGTKNWFTQCLGSHSNWDPDPLPGEDDTATIPAGLGPVIAGAGAGTTIIRLKSLQAPGGLRIGSVDLVLQDPSAITGFEWFDTVITSGAFGATPGLTMSGTSAWGNNGTLQGLVGQSQSGSTLFRNVGRLESVGTGIVTSAGLENEAGGELTVRSRIALKPNAFAVNRGTWVFTSSAAISRFDVNNDPDTALFTNAGILRKTAIASTQRSEIAVRLVSDTPGVIEVAGGQLFVSGEAFFGGRISVAAGALFNSQPPATAPHTFRGEVRLGGAGQAFLVGGTANRHRVEGVLVNEIGDAADETRRVLLSNVDIELAQGASLDNEGRLDWGDQLVGAGAIHGAGQLYNGSPALLSVLKPASLSANFVNNGTVRQSASLKVGDTTAPLENNEGAIWELRSGGEILAAPMTTPQGIDNRGSIEVAVNVPDASIEPPLDIDGNGSVAIAGGGVLTLSGGGRWMSPVPVALDGELRLSAPQTVARTYVVEQESTVTPLNDGGSVFVLSRATLRVNGSLTTTFGEGALRTPVNVFVDSGAITGPGTFDNGGALEVKRGQLGDAAGAPLTLLNHGSVIVRESGNTLVGTLINDIDPFAMVGLSPLGVFATENSELTVSAGSVIDSRRGVVTLQGAAKLLGGGRLRNAGTLRKVLGSPSTVALRVDNPGTISVENGELTLDGIVDQVQGNTLTGGTWRVDAGASLTITGAQITTIGAGASVSVGGEQLTGSAFKNVRFVFGSFGVSTVFQASSMTVGPSGKVATGAGSGQRQRLARRFFSRGVAGPAPVGPETRFALAGGPFLNEGAVEPGGIGAVGPCGIDGSYTQEAGGVLHLDLGPAEHDQLVVSGPAALGGSLVVDLIDGYVPAPSDTIVVVEGDSISGRFANAVERVFTSAGAFDVAYTATQVVLSNFDPSAATPTPSAPPTVSTPATPGTTTPTAGATPSGTPPAAPTATASPTPTSTPPAAECPGDCDGNGVVAVNELVLGVNIALGTSPIDSCPAFDVTPDRAVSVAELVAAVNAALSGCER